MTSPLGFKARVGSALFAIFAEANVMYIPQDSPLVLHLPTSCRPARSRSLPHMHVQRWENLQNQLHIITVPIYIYKFNSFKLAYMLHSNSLKLVIHINDQLYNSLKTNPQISIVDTCLS